MEVSQKTSEKENLSACQQHALPQHFQGSPPPLKAETVKVEEKRHQIWCDVQRSIRYHRAREAFFQWYANAISFLTLLAGSGVVVTLLAENDLKSISVALGVSVAAMQAIELVFQVTTKARLHSSLAGEFAAIARVLAKNPELNASEMNEISADILVIEAREPPIKRYLDLICHNQVAKAIGSSDVEKLTFLQRTCAHWLSGDTALHNKS